MFAPRLAHETSSWRLVLSHDVVAGDLVQHLQDRGATTPPRAHLDAVSGAVRQALPLEMGGFVFWV